MWLAAALACICVFASVLELHGSALPVYFLQIKIVPTGQTLSMNVTNSTENKDVQQFVIRNTKIFNTANLCLVYGPQKDSPCVAFDGGKFIYNASSYPNGSIYVECLYNVSIVLQGGRVKARIGVVNTTTVAIVKQLARFYLKAQISPDAAKKALDSDIYLCYRKTFLSNDSFTLEQCVVPANLVPSIMLVLASKSSTGVNSCSQV